MKENKYDNEIFFEKYSKMSRSKEGLKGAGEWSTLEQLLPDFRDKNVLDLGCGYGWHCLQAAKMGAKSVVGVDISEKMLQAAREKNGFEIIKYICQPIEDIEFEKESFDIVLSSLAFHYVKSFEDIVKKIAYCMKKGGSFIFSAEHPIFTSSGDQQWYKDKNDEIVHFPVDNYFYEGERNALFLGEEVIKYHRTLTTYLNTLLESGFELVNIIEPQPTAEMIESIPEMKEEMRRPMMIIISARKK